MSFEKSNLLRKIEKKNDICSLSNMSFFFDHFLLFNFRKMESFFL